MFRLAHDGKTIGRSALEDCDPPMGCAEGAFLPDAAFAQFQATVAPQAEDDPAIRRWTGLTCSTEDGREVPCLDAVLFAYDFGVTVELRVDVLGIDAPLYETLFPGRFAAYEASFADPKR